MSDAPPERGTEYGLAVTLKAAGTGNPFCGLAEHYRPHCGQISVWHGVLLDEGTRAFQSSQTYN